MRFKMVAVLGVIVVGAAAGPVGEASAVPGLVRVDASSATESSATKTVAASCPTGKRVLGGGGKIDGGGGEVALEQVQPTQTVDDERFVASASEDGTGFGGDWQLTAYALCADPLPGQQIIGADPPTLRSDSTQAANTFCPAGQGQVGWGGRINNGAGQVRLTGLFQFYVGAPPIGTIVNAREDADGYDGSWSLTPYTVCADGVPLVSASGATSPATSDDKAATVSCPAGTQVHAAGGLLGQTTGQRNGLVIDEISVDDSLTSVTLGVAEDETGTNDAWTATAIALCLP
jgi:hypothetical protein